MTKENIQGIIYYKHHHEIGDDSYYEFLDINGGVKVRRYWTVECEPKSSGVLCTNDFGNMLEDIETEQEMMEMVDIYFTDSIDEIDRKFNRLF